MLDMGFLPDMMKLVKGMGIPSERQTLMFSATFPEEVQKLARDILDDYIFVTVGRVGGANIDIEQRVLQVDKPNKRNQLVTILNEQGLSLIIIVFVIIVFSVPCFLCAVKECLNTNGRFFLSRSDR